MNEDFTNAQWKVIHRFFGKVVLGIVGWVAFWTGLSRLIY